MSLLLTRHLEKYPNLAEVLLVLPSMMLLELKLSLFNALRAKLKKGKKSSTPSHSTKLTSLTRDLKVSLLFSLETPVISRKMFVTKSIIRLPNGEKREKLK